MVIKRLILIVLTILIVVKVSFSLIASWGEPQIQSRLELYQTNLLLHAAQWEGKESTSDVKDALKSVLGEDPFKTAQKQYEEAQQSNQKALAKIEQQLAIQPQSDTATKPFPKTGREKLQQSQFRQLTHDLNVLIDELDLRLGILQAHRKESEQAIATWNNLIKRANEVDQSEISNVNLVNTSKILIGLWSQPSQLLPNPEEAIQKNLDGWFRYRGLTQLYQLQQRPEALAELEAKEQQIAEKSLLKLLIVSSIPVIGCLVGVGLLIFLAVQLLLKGKRSLLAQNAELAWTTPWNAETVWQVLVLGFFFIGQFLLPLFFGSLRLDPGSLDIRGKALFVMLSYLLLALGGLGVLYLSIKSFLPLPEGWFRVSFKGGWFLWGLGGYFIALPLVIIVSLINQKFWQGQGGSNPILSLALEGKDSVALTIFFVTASIAAPLFEEIIFRGFLLPSLTRYLPVWAAIATSGLLFAIAHLSLSEVLPLATLGIILGIVYTRSRNLLAPILLHSLWNSGTLLSLFVLGSGAK